MKAMVGFLFFMLFLGCLAFVMMMGKDLAKTRTQPELALSRADWRLSPMEWLGDADVDIRLVIQKDGQLSGHAACNSYSGSYQLDKDGIRFEQIRTTRKACQAPIMTIEAEFLRRLGSAATYKVGRYGLVLADAQERETLRFKAIAQSVAPN